MSSYEKLVARVINNPRNVTFNELDTILLREGCRKKDTKSSHFKYWKEGEDWVLTVPYKRPHLSVIYVKQALEYLRLEE